MRKAIAKRLSDSKFSAPHYYLNIEMEMDNMISFRQQFINTQNIKISFNDIIAKAVALLLLSTQKLILDGMMTKSYSMNIFILVLLLLLRMA